MSSRRILELVNAILHQLCDNEAPFGSKQFVFVGEFFQLKPVPSSFDRGEFMFLSEPHPGGCSVWELEGGKRAKTPPASNS